VGVKETHSREILDFAEVGVEERVAGFGSKLRDELGYVHLKPLSVPA
jgi:hypothetical protein